MSRLIVLSIFLSLLTVTGAWAEPQTQTHILFSLDADVNDDGVAERMLVGSQVSPNPTAEAPKEFMICEKQGERYVPVYRKDLGKWPFHTALMPFQWSGATTALPGISIRRYPGVAPQIYLVFASNSEELLIFQYINGKYKEI